MTDNSLSLTYQEIAAQVGDFLGFGRGEEVYGETAWNGLQTRAIKESVKAGLRQFYNTPPIERFDPGAYEWSFLEPVATLSLASGAQTIELPDDYASLSAPLLLAADDSRSSVPIPMHGVPAVYAKYAENPATTGRPMMACEEPLRGRSSVLGQKMQIRVWPIADADYEFSVPYRLNAPALSGEFPLAYGGQQHAQTILASCIAAASVGRDEQKAMRYQDFIEKLQTSIRLDRLNKPQFMGRNRDRSDWHDRRGHSAAIRGEGLVSVNGVIY